MMKDNRIQRINLRLDSREYDLLVKMYGESGFSNRSNFIRKLIFTGKIVKEEDSKKDLRDLVYELNRVGNNFNQVVKLLHTRKVAYIGEVELDLLKESIKNIGLIYAKINAFLEK